MAKSMTGNVTGYSTAQVALHWSVVVLVVFQFVANSGMAQAWRALRGGTEPAGDVLLMANLHAAAGILILLLALARVYLKVTRGTPKPPANEPRILQIVAEATHGLLYLLLFLVPLSGAAAWFGGAEQAAAGHVVLKTALMLVVLVHVAGALFQHFVRRTDVLMRMLRPQRSL